MTYAIVGDSQAEGLAPAFRERGILVRDFRGYTTSRLIAEAQNLLLQNPNVTTLVVVSGGNDTPNAAYADAVGRMYDAVVRFGGRELIWVGPVHAQVSPDSEVHPQVAQIQKTTLTGKPRARWINGADLTRDLSRPSNVHLTAANYRVFADRLASRLTVGSGLAIAAVVAFGLWWWLRR